MRLATSEFKVLQLRWTTWDIAMDMLWGMGLTPVYVNEASGLISNSDSGVLGLALCGVVQAVDGDWIVQGQGKPFFVKENDFATHYELKGES